MLYAEDVFFDDTIKAVRGARDVQEYLTATGEPIDKGTLAGVGFTMSLFIGTLAYEGPEYATAVRVGVLSGSFVSGLFGYSVMRHVPAPDRSSDQNYGFRCSASS